MFKELTWNSYTKSYNLGYLSTNDQLKGNDNLQVMFTITFNCYDTIAYIQKYILIFNPSNKNFFMLQNSPMI